MKTYLLPIFALLIVGCGNQPNTEKWPIKPTNGIAARLIELDSMSRAILGDASKTQDEVAQLLQGDDFDTKAMQQMRDSADLVWHTFIRLCNEEKIKEAFDLYRVDKNRGYFLIALEHSTARYLFHYEIIAGMAANLLPEQEAYELIIRDLELDLMLTEGMIGVNGKQYIPEHYTDLVKNLADFYREAKMWGKAFDLANRMPEILSKAGSDPVFAYSVSKMYKAGIYKAKGDILESLKTLRQLKAYLVKEIKTSDNKEVLQGVLQVVDNTVKEVETEKWHILNGAI